MNSATDAVPFVMFWLWALLTVSLSRLWLRRMLRKEEPEVALTDAWKLEVKHNDSYDGRHRRPAKRR